MSALATLCANTKVNVELSKIWESEPPNTLPRIEVSAIVSEFAPVGNPGTTIGVPVTSESLRANKVVGGGWSTVKLFGPWVQTPTHASGASTVAWNVLDDEIPVDEPPGVKLAVLVSLSRMVIWLKSPNVRVAPPSLVRMKPLMANNDSANESACA